MCDCDRIEDKELEIKIKYLTDVEPIEKMSIGDWIDLRAAVDIHYHKDEFFKVPLGVAMQLPEGYEALVASRSSTYKNWRIRQVNAPGVIDESYCGDNDEWLFAVVADGNGVIKKNDRVCQFRIIRKMPPVKLKVVKNLNNKDRGGFGSTGTK